MRFSLQIDGECAASPVPNVRRCCDRFMERQNAVLSLKRLMPCLNFLAQIQKNAEDFFKQPDIGQGVIPGSSCRLD